MFLPFSGGCTRRSRSPREKRRIRDDAARCPLCGRYPAFIFPRLIGREIGVPKPIEKHMWVYRLRTNNCGWGKLLPNQKKEAVICLAVKSRVHRLAITRTVRSRVLLPFCLYVSVCTGIFSFCNTLHFVRADNIRICTCNKNQQYTSTYIVLYQDYSSIYTKSVHIRELFKPQHYLRSIPSWLYSIFYYVIENYSSW